MKGFSLAGKGVLSGLVALMALGVPASARADPYQPDLPTEKLNEFAEVFSLIRAAHVSPVDESRLIEAAIGGMVSSLDPHSTYLNSEALKEFEADQQGSFVGIGIEAELTGSGFVVIAPMDQSPAARAGIRAGDIVTRVNGVPVSGMSRLQAGRSLRGPENTEVALEVMPASGADRKTVRLMRQAIHEPSVKARLAEPGFALVRIAQFRASTVAEFTAAMASLGADATPVKGLVLDLRDNPGGLLASALGVASGFLPESATVLSIRGRLSAQDTVLRADTPSAPSGHPVAPARLQPWLRTVPLVVLVNAGSASAAEVLAAALQDNRRAVLVGATTFGKGSVQEIIPVGKSSAVKLTVARYFTPSGRSIQAQGIRPDLAVPGKGEQSGQPTVREADLEHHLPAEGAEPAVAASAVERPDAPPATAFGRDADPQFSAALAYLKQPAGADESARR